MAEKVLKSLILVESAMKAKTLRKFVGRYYSVLSTDGFLKDLPKSRIGVDDKYQPDYITVRGKGKLLAELRRETLNARRIFLATNPDTQGEFLARQCCEVFGINPLSHCRILLEELTKKSFKAAFDAARPIDDKLADAFQAKQFLCCADKLSSLHNRLIYSWLTEKNSSAQLKIDGTMNDAALMAKFDKLGVDWAEYYSVGIASLIKRKYITAENSIYKVTALGQRVLDAIAGFFDDVFNANSYNEITAQVNEVATGQTQKLSVIENYCTKFNVDFDKAMTELGEDAKPQSEPVVEADEVCDKCGRKMLIRRGRYGAFLACSGYPDCKNTKPLLELLDKKCPKCGGRLAKRSLLHGRIVYCCESCDFSTWDEPQTITCKTCGSTMFVHKFKDRAPMLYCGNDDCPTRTNHPMNKILTEIKRRAEARKKRKELKSEVKS